MHGFQKNLAQLFIRNICSGRLKVKVTLEGQIINGRKLSLSRQELLHLCMDLKIIWHSSLFEIVILVSRRSKSHWKVRQ